MPRQRSSACRRSDLLTEVEREIPDVPSWLRVGRWVGYFLFILLLLYQTGKGWISATFVAIAVFFLVGAILYAMAGRVVLRRHSRAQLRPYFRPYILGITLCIGLLLLYRFLGHLNRP